ncbi:hypothetical protein CRM22_006161 [Opisthorchis felineus]|uniref:DNA helicase n=1 Tax=Opisthorchis felineus TaxID=147828 RepID=A0A4S2LMH8_OPIFE|nr:hypothetical protein CRM22_006161 [Opisthorchis felineus]TGZ64875.1 hypothetical protein CRM22_006161 [Opisthorchis felineus]
MSDVSETPGLEIDDEKESYSTEEDVCLTEPEKEPPRSPSTHLVDEVTILQRRKSSRQRKATKVVEDSDSPLNENASESNGRYHPKPDTCSVDLETERRMSLRPRRKAKKSEMYQDEKELDQLLSDEVNLQAYGPAQHWNTGAGDYISDDWLSVERILAHRRLEKRKLTEFISEALKSYTAIQKKMVEMEYFVKFHDLSYWQCAWMSGAILMALHPGLVRNYFKNVREQSEEKEAIDSRNTEIRAPDAEMVTTQGTEPNPPQDISTNSVALPSSEDQPKPDGPQVESEKKKSGPSSLIIPHSSEEDEDDENDLTKWSTEYKENLTKWMSPNLESSGSRRRYLVRWGVESDRLVPERIITVGETVDVSASGAADSEAVEDVPGELEFREVLVKWFSVPESQATWETIETDLDMLSELAAYQKIHPKAVFQDSNGRRLLPLVVRRSLIQMMNTYCTRLARMLCDAYGAQHTIGKRPPPTDWKTKWQNSQPSYLSPEQHAVLHPYQLEGVRWLWHAYHNHVNAILADEMGLGKTVQVIALLYSLWKERNDYGPFLVAAPLSTLQNWAREFEVWAPEFHVLVYSGERSARATMQRYDFRIPNSGGVPAFHVLITSHELACIERSCLQGFDWSVLVVDEAHRLKNKQSRLFKEASQYKAGFKMLLTGTPLQNNLEELFHLLYFIEPKTVTDFKTLSEQWANMSKEQRIASLHDQLKNHLLRRLKSDVIKDLPKKSEVVVMVDMSVLQRKLYKLILTKNYEELRCGSLMNSLVHLQKVCDHPYLLPAGDSISPRIDPDQPNARYEPKALVHVSGKLVVLMEMLRGLREGGHRVLIYSRMTTMLDILEEALTNEGYAFERIDGRVKGPLRQIIVDRFNARNCETFIFLLSTRAGGEGINLASADTVILYDSDWNPQCDLQALSRAHRIGQSRHVVVYRFVTRHSMEERLNFVARRKLALTNLVVNQQQQRIQQKALKAQSDMPVGTVEDPIAPADQEPTEASSKNQESVKALPESLTVPSSAPAQPREGTVSNRLSRAEMDDMLRCGIEALFAVDDMLDENDLKKAARSLSENVENSADSERIVYNADALARLLDRAKLEAEANEEEARSTADEYLHAFRVAHFDVTSVVTPEEKRVPTESQTTVTPPPETSAETEINAVMDATPQEEDSSTQALGYAAFWDRLLRERHNRLCKAEAEGAPSELSRRVSKASWRLKQHCHAPESEEDSLQILDQDDIGSSTDATIDRGRDSRRSKGAGRDLSDDNNDLVEEIPAHDKIRRRYERFRQAVGVDPSKPRGQQRTSASRRRRRKQARRPANPNRVRRPRPTSEPEEIAPDLEASEEGGGNSDNDPSYIPSGEESDDVVSDAELLNRWRKREKLNVGADDDEEVLYLSDSDERVANLEPVAFGNLLSDMWATASWHPDPAVCAVWREAVNKLDAKITCENGHMFIYGFGPENRTSFANAVMRYGLPPPGIIPPQDWLPPSLFHIGQQRLYAYTALFMYHLYADPNALDDTVDHWSDGIPKENLCASAVLSRIAMMALIRNKVLQFEDINGVHSRTFEAVSTRFKFSIHEGGLTLLRPTWHEEWQRINAMVDAVSPDNKRERAMFHLQHTWHSRHDYWLLAAIHVHGYLRWSDILTDPRFHLLNTGLDGVLEASEKKTESQEKNAESSSQQTNSLAEAQAFLVSRLRMLEQALVVEQALFEVARAALTGSTDGKPSPLTRVQNLAVCLSNKLASAGPRKRIALPRDTHAREATRAAVQNLQDILEDLYADLPGLPASVICAEPETSLPVIPSSPTSVPNDSHTLSLTSNDGASTSIGPASQPSGTIQCDPIPDQSVDTPVLKISSPTPIKPSPPSSVDRGVIEISDEEI